MSRSLYIACDHCHGLVRVDDGSYATRNGTCEHLDADRRHHNSESSMVVFKSADGRTSIPWSPDVPTPVGFQRVEVRGAHNVRKLEREMDAHDLKRHKMHKESIERVFGPELEARRNNLKELARSAPHPFSRALAQAALDKQSRGYSENNWEAGNHRD